MPTNRKVALNFHQNGDATPPVWAHYVSRSLIEMGVRWEGLRVMHTPTEPGGEP
jgi:hypothetical protein